MPVGRLQGSAAIYLAANIAVASVPFLLLPILTHYLPPQEYGVVAMFTTLLPLLGAFVGLSVHGAISRRWFDRGEIDIAQYVSGCILILLVSSALIALLLLAPANWIAEKVSIPVFWLYGAVSVSVFSFLIQIRLVVWQVSGKPKPYAIFQACSALVNASISVVLIVFFLKGADGRLWGYTLAFFLFAVLSVVSLYRDGLINFETRRLYVRDALLWGVPLVPHVIGGFLLLVADRFVVNDLLGVKYAGIYMVAVQVAMGLEIVNGAANKAFVPWLFAKLKSGNYEEKLRVVRVTYCYFVFLLLVVIAVAFLSEHIVNILVGGEYSMAAEVLPWLVLAQAFNGMYYLSTNYLFFEGKTHITSAITISCGVSGLLLTWWLVSFIGLKGAAIGTATSMLLQFCATWVAASRIHPMPWITVRLSR